MSERTACEVCRDFRALNRVARSQATPIDHLSGASAEAASTSGSGGMASKWTDATAVAPVRRAREGVCAYLHSSSRDVKRGTW